MSNVRRRNSGGGQSSSESMMENSEGNRNIKGDEWNIAILLGLYVMQGIPLGLASAVPMLLQSRGATFKQQAEFSFVNWPFSLKLLWAPLVDSLYLPKFGRRKTWLVPSQYLIGFFMIILSFHVESWLGSSEPTVEPQIFLLTCFFFLLNFLAATQDIAVDGWALTMLQRRNVGYASTCNSVGQTAGYFIGYVIFIALESRTFCNNYLNSSPQETGLITFPGFLFFWGVSFVVVTSLITLLKGEVEETSHMWAARPLQAALSSYKKLIDILSLHNIRVLAICLLTSKIGFAACDAVTSLKLMEGGLPKEKMAILAVPLIPLQLVLPLVLAKVHNPARPLDIYVKVIPYRLSYNIVAAFFVYVTPSLIRGGEIPSVYYFVLLILLALHQVCLYSMFVEAMAFFNLISDPALGGTNMTLLNTLHNLGGTWTSTVALWAVDYLTVKSCSADPTNSCSQPALLQSCEEIGGSCSIVSDGYYIETAVCTVLGVLWYLKGKGVMQSLQTRPLHSWMIR